MKKKLLSLFLAVSMLATLVAGCGDSSDTGSTADTTTTTSTETGTLQAQEGENIVLGTESSANNDCVTDERESKQEIHVAISQAPANLDIMVNAIFIGHQIAGNGQIYEQLVTLDESNQPIPELAESFEVSEDNTVWTYHLRQGVKFHNGKEMTAEDVVASLNRWIDRVAIATTLFGDARFEEIDDYTVQVTLERGSANVNIVLAGASSSAIITTKEAVESESDGIMTEIVGTGPYMLDEWVTDQYIKLTKFDDYSPYGTEGEFSGWGGYKTAYIKDIYFDIVTDNTTRIAGLETGQYDMLYVPCPLDNFEQLEYMEGTTLIQENRGNFMMTYNCQGDVTKTKEVRQAINMLLNYDEVMTSAFVGPQFYTIDPSVMFNSSSIYYTDAGSAGYYQNDPEGAKALLESIGYDFSTPIKILTPTNYQEYYNACLDVANQLESIGLNVQFESMDWASCCSTMKSGEGWDLFLCTNNEGVIPSALPYFSGPTADGYPNDEKLLSLSDEVLFAPSEEESIAKWKEMQEYVLTDYTNITSFGPWMSYSVIKGDYDMSYMKGAIFWNAKFYED